MWLLGAVSRVYPRACGERSPNGCIGLPSTGLSPRLRGTGGDRVRPVPPHTVYPRACGERSTSHVPGAVTRGLSPRLRGTGSPGHDRNGLRRFIPAPAGNGRLSSRVSWSRSVYPRACGERGKFLAERVDGIGLSPRLRGTVREFSMLIVNLRFIPAPAGNGSYYPNLAIANGGLSPRLRGTGVHPESR